MQTWVIILIVSIVVFWIVVLGIISNLLKKRAVKVLEKFEGKKIYGVNAGANFFGLQSVGLGQVRGNGVLLLTEDELYFEMLAPKKEVLIPIESIKEITTPKFHLKKTKNRPLLKVTFVNKKGQTDSAAWQVKNLPAWRDSLLKMIDGD